MRRLASFSVVLALWAAPVQAAPSSSAVALTDTVRLSLDDAVNRALSSGSDLRVAQANVGIADGRVKEAAAGALPQITGTVTYNKKFDSIFSSLAGDTTLGSLFSNSSFAAEHTWTADLTVTQTLWSGGRVGSALRGALAYRKVARADRDETRADIALRVREAYLQAVYAREVEAIAYAGLEQARAHLKRVQLFKDQGSRAEYDLIQAQVDAANQEPPAVEARDAAAISLLQLKRLLGMSLAQPIALTTPLSFEAGQVPVLASEPADGAARAALVGAEENVKFRRHALTYEKAGRWPQLLASGTVSHQAFPTETWPDREQFRRAIDGSIKLEWPLFQGFRTFGTVQRARAELAQAEAAREQTRQGVELEVEQARNEVRARLATLVARRGTVTLATRANHLATVRYQNGLATQLEVSDSRLKMQTAQVNEVAASKDYRIALLQLERATGQPLTLVPRSMDDITSSLQSDEGR